MDHEEESEMAETTSKEGITSKHTVDKRAKESQEDDECAIKM